MRFRFIACASPESPSVTVLGVVFYVRLHWPPERIERAEPGRKRPRLGPVIGTDEALPSKGFTSGGLRETSTLSSPDEGAFVASGSGGGCVEPTHYERNPKNFLDIGTILGSLVFSKAFPGPWAGDAAHKKSNIRYMPKGTIKWFDQEKGYGFIQQDEGGKDLFVHHTETDGYALFEGDAVDYEVGEGRKGPCATNVKKG